MGGNRRLKRTNGADKSTTLIAGRGKKIQYRVREWVIKKRDLNSENVARESGRLE